MRILSSPRWRRRLAPPLVVAAIAAPLIYLGIHLSSPGDKGAATGPEVNLPGYAQPKHAPFTKAKQREVRKVLREFILTAVDRQHVGRSWEISAPSLRAGFTRKQWGRGDLPVVPYPAANRGLGDWSFVHYSTTDTIGLEVFLLPKRGSGWSAMTADVELVKGHDGKWRVDYWMPKKFHGPPSLAKTKPTATRKASPARAVPVHRAAGRRKAAPPPVQAVGTPKPSRVWWILPIALLSLIVLVPLAIALNSWHRNRQAQRDYLRAQGRS
ncbi:MAG TPA: hypothetical protein VLD13_09855 [Gaiellaceae bacterium]|nr:hypothetical protein [Gaiellaceae bacterium]